MKTAIPHSPSNLLSPKKSPSNLRVGRLNNKSDSIKVVNSFINKSIEPPNIRSMSKTSYSPVKTRRETVSIEPVSSSRLMVKRPKEPIKTELSMSKSGKAWIDNKSNSALTKAEAARFSPYVSAKKEEEIKDKLLYKLSEKFSIKISNFEGSKHVKKSENIVPDVLIIRPAIISKEARSFSFVLGKGNNDKAVRRVLLKRSWWKETSASSVQQDFCWFQTNKPINFAQLTGKSRKSANHFEFNREIGTKNNLLKNLQQYCEKSNQELFKVTPLTYTLDLHSPHYNSELQTFIKCFKDFAARGIEETHTEEIKDPLEHEIVKSEVVKIDSSKTDVSSNKIDNKGKSKSNLNTPRVPTKATSIAAKLPSTYYDGCNLWLLKPTDFNRGRGINLFNKLPTFEQYLKSFQTGEDLTSAKPGSSSSPTINGKGTMNLVKCSKFVVQKYIEKPMLIDQRKFDIRVWVLVDQEMNVYVFKEGYLRLSSEPFSLSETHVEDKYVHLTNNAVQKYGENYGKHESGNIISLNELEKYLPKDDPNVTLSKMKDRMKDLIKISMNSVKFKINAGERKNCFEVFGYDFIVDAEFNTYIIEVNSNPSIDESNALLSTIVPRMLDDMFKLTLDKMYVPTINKTTKADSAGLKEEETLAFAVEGYTNEENLWSYIANIAVKKS